MVHEHHGIGRFVGMTNMKVDGVEKDYVKIAYAGADVLYVPATQLDLVSKYIGGGEDSAETHQAQQAGGHRLGEGQDQGQKGREGPGQGAHSALRPAAAPARLRLLPPTPRGSGSLRTSLSIAETDDQLRCIAEIKPDMERPVPMDRLLCGDVGYGKTEVAFRAVMKCVLDGKQAAILVPTTVLAQQHYLRPPCSRFARATR